MTHDEYDAAARLLQAEARHHGWDYTENTINGRRWCEMRAWGLSRLQLDDVFAALVALACGSGASLELRPSSEAPGTMNMSMRVIGPEAVATVADDGREFIS